MHCIAVTIAIVFERRRNVETIYCTKYDSKIERVGGAFMFTEKACSDPDCDFCRRRPDILTDKECGECDYMCERKEG
jgi:hypothetical protein